MSSASAEVVFCAVDYLREIGLTGADVVVRISSREMLAAVLKSFGIAENQLEGLYAVLDKRSKVSEDAFEEMLAEVLAEHSKREKVIRLMAAESIEQISSSFDLDDAAAHAVHLGAFEEGGPRAFNFPRAWLEGNWNFSFSGLKTAVLREVRRLQSERRDLPVVNLAASFQQAVVDVLVGKTLKAAEVFHVRDILIAGGVSANRALRTTLLAQADLPVHIPPLALCTDNAAMIAAAGYFRFANGQRDSLEIDALPNWPLSEL